jgi:hypothetical protein
MYLINSYDPYLDTTIHVTDGVSTIVGMLATQMNDKVENGEIKEFSLIWVKEYITNDLNGVR